jgi:hypothetical protein
MSIVTHRICRICIVIFILISPLHLFAQGYFSWTSKTGNNATIGVLLETDIWINGEKIMPGDEIGVFTPDGLCVGGMEWCGERNRTITVWGDNIMTDEVDGIRENEKMHFRIWRQEVDEEFEFTHIHFKDGDEVYRVNGIYILDELRSDGVPAVPLLLFPADNASDVPVTPLFLWEFDGPAETYGVQIALNMDFTGPILDTTIVNNNRLTVELEHDTKYYWRVQAHNSRYASAWSDVRSFTTSERSDIMMIPLEAGWNLISSYLRPGDVEIEKIFAPLSHNESLIVKNSRGDIYWPEEGINNIHVWNITEGYHVYSDRRDTLYIHGKKIDPSGITLELKQGWNTPAFLFSHPVATETSLGPIREHIELVKTHDGRLYWPVYGFDTIEYLEPGKAYEIYLNEDTEFVHTAGPLPDDSSSASVDIAEVTTEESGMFYVPEMTRTGENAVLLVRADFAHDGDEIGVWDAQDNLVGAGTVKNNRAAVFVWGDNDRTGETKDGAVDGELLSLTWYSRNTLNESEVKIRSAHDVTAMYGLASSLRYHSHGITIVQTYVEFSPEEIGRNYALSQNYPNPFNPSTLITYNIPDNEFVRLTVYSITGQVVATLVEEEQRAGRYTVAFDASHISSGVYIYRIQAGYFTETRKMLLIR